MEVLEDKNEGGEALILDVRERRQYARMPCEGFAEAVVLHPESLFRGEIRDISQGGCFIHTPAPLHVEPRMEVDLRFILNNNHYHFEATVANVREGDGFGLRFLAGRNSASVESLDSLIQMLRE
jgi:hypothetical protein